METIAVLALTVGVATLAIPVALLASRFEAREPGREPAESTEPGLLQN